MALNDSDNLVEFPGASHSISPELEFLLMGLTEAQKQTVIDAFYGFARGDAQGFNARFDSNWRMRVKEQKYERTDEN